MKLVLATNNKDKIREMKNLLNDLPVEILTRDDFENFPDVEETGTTLEANARLKATAIAQFTGHPALADDSGLEVDYLDGRPGVYSSRYAGEDVTYADNNRKLLEELEGVPEERRGAKFRCVIAIDWGNEDIEIAVGEAEGRIATDVGGKEGFGYDPVFYYTQAKMRFSEMTLEEKNRVSHRGLALKGAKYVITERLDKMRLGN